MNINRILLVGSFFIVIPAILSLHFYLRDIYLEEIYKLNLNLEDLNDELLRYKRESEESARPYSLTEVIEHIGTMKDFSGKEKIPYSCISETEIRTTDFGVYDLYQDFQPEDIIMFCRAGDNTLIRYQNFESDILVIKSNTSESFESVRRIDYQSLTFNHLHEQLNIVSWFDDGTILLELRTSPLVVNNGPFGKTNWVNRVIYYIDLYSEYVIEQCGISDNTLTQCKSSIIKSYSSY